MRRVRPHLARRRRPAAKAWYLVLHRRSVRTFVAAGTCIQGFLLGTFATVAIASTATATPVGLFLDASTPGLFLAMAVGRPGCFLGGCCVGRPTASRWGLWSSDRRLGVRRIPVQLLEAALALGLGAATLTLVLAGPLPLPGRCSSAPSPSTPQAGSCCFRCGGNHDAPAPVAH